MGVAGGGAMPILLNGITMPLKPARPLEAAVRDVLRRHAPAREPLLKSSAQQNADPEKAKLMSQPLSEAAAIARMSSASACSMWPRFHPAPSSRGLREPCRVLPPHGTICRSGCI